MEQTKPKGRAFLKDGAIFTQFSYDPSIILQIKEIDGRRWWPDLKQWSVPVCDEAVRLLTSLNFSIDEEVLSKAEIQEIETLPPISLAQKLFPYQERGVKFIESRKGRALLADDMGLGKSLQTIAWLQLHQDLTPVVIICPASVKWNWEREWHKWTDEQSITVLEGRKLYSVGTRIIILNYDLLTYWKDQLKLLKPKVIVFDEAHYLKASGTKRTKTAKEICKKVDHIILLTGTPIINRPIEIFNALSILDPNRWNSQWTFARKFCNARHNGFGWDFSGASHTDELHKILTATVMLRREKGSVLKDLPPKTKSVLPLEIINRKEYDSVVVDIKNWINDKVQSDSLSDSTAEAMVKIEALKQIAVKGKLDESKNWITDFIHSGQKLVVFATHRFVLDALMSEFGNIAVKVDGSIIGEDRQKAVEKFQTDPECKLFIGGIKAAGVGITLTAASHVVFLELPWSPADCDQAEDRLHRIGQTDSVAVWYLVAINTIEEDIIELLDRKRKVVTSIVDGKDVVEETILKSLLEKLQQELS